MTMRLDFPLFMFVFYLMLGFRYFEIFEPLGWWQHIIAPLPMLLVFWFLFDKLNLKEKRVDIGVGVLIIIAGFIISIILETFVFGN